jgi:hypothetical protein
MVNGKEKQVTFQEYYRKRKESAGPYGEVSRDQAIVDFRKAREAAKELWEKEQEERARLEEEAKRALELELQE